MSCIKAVHLLREIGCTCCLLILIGCQSSAVSTDSELADTRGHASSQENKGANGSAFETSAISLFDKAGDALKEGEFDAARVFLLKLTAERPGLVSPWINLGIVSRNLGDTGAAVKAFNRALVNQPGSCEALNQLGVLAREAGNYEEAESRYLACLEVVPEFSEVHLNLGILYELYMGKYASALSSYHSYLAGLSEPDRQVGNWIKDLERRQSSMLATDNF